MGRSPQVSGFLDGAWPAVTPEGLVFSLLSSPELMAAAAADVLTAAEQALIVWPKPPRSVRAAQWSPADAVLLDEASGLLERPGGFGHVVIDEAQDLSPMQCRAIARRSEHGSVTLLGDLAQGTSPWAARDWQITLGHLGKPDTQVVPLTMGFRVPESILALANRLLPALDVAVPPAQSLRHDGSLTIRSVDDIPLAIVDEVRAALVFDGSIGVIAADDALPAVIEALTAAEIDFGDADADTRVTVLPATVAKGLEYDHVVIVEPAQIVAAEARGLSRLYVVLTRAVSRLAIVHHEPLPPELG
jgi:DNA helicase IV